MAVLPYPQICSWEKVVGQKCWGSSQRGVGLVPGSPVSCLRALLGQASSLGVLAFESCPSP